MNAKCSSYYFSHRLPVKQVCTIEEAKHVDSYVDAKQHSTFFFILHCSQRVVQIVENIMRQGLLFFCQLTEVAHIVVSMIKAFSRRPLINLTNQSLESNAMVEEVF